MTGDDITLLAVGLLAVLACVYAALWYRHFYRHEHFVCPKCGYAFKPEVLKMIFSVNAVTGKIIRCPRCGSKEYMEPVKDTNR